MYVYVRSMKFQNKHLRPQQIILRSVEIYSSTIHSTTQIKPVDFIAGNINPTEFTKFFVRIKDAKENTVTKLNTNRDEVKLPQNNVILVHNLDIIRHKEHPREQHLLTTNQ